MTRTIKTSVLPEIADCATIAFAGTPDAAPRGPTVVGAPLADDVMAKPHLPIVLSNEDTQDAPPHPRP